VQTEGLPAFVRRAFLVVVRFFFSCENYYIYEKTLNDANELQFTPKIPNCTLKIVSTPEEVDELIAEGFHINAYLDISGTKARISRKAILFCAFVGKELAYKSWIAFSEEAKRDVDMLPYTVDFETEACLGDDETVPKYRRLGIHTYVTIKRYQFVNERGLKSKLTVRRDNIAAQKTQSRVGSRIYAEGRYLKLLGWKSWKEKPIGGSN